MPGIKPGAQTATKVTSVKLEVSIDKDQPCALNLNGTITADGLGKIWWRFDGPEGVTYDFGQEDTFDLTIDNWVGFGKGAKFTHDIRGQFKVEAAVQRPDGKRGPVTFSNAVPVDFKCAGGAAPAENQPTPSVSRTAQSGAVSARVTEVRLEVTPAEYMGPCPAKVQLVGSITANGPGTAYY